MHKYWPDILDVHCAVNEAFVNLIFQTSLIKIIKLKMVDTKAGELFITRDQLDENSQEVYQWSMEQLKQEIVRLEKQGVQPIEI